MSTPEIIAARLDALAAEMLDVATMMEYYGGFNGRMAQHGREMAGAASIAREWAREIAAEAGDA